MIFIGLLSGFAAGIACACGFRALRRAHGAPWTGSRMKPEQPDGAKLPESRELARLRRQLAEIERYTGSSVRGADETL